MKNELAFFSFLRSFFGKLTVMTSHNILFSVDLICVKLIILKKCDQSTVFTPLHM